jgi:hypothetical protein
MSWNGLLALVLNVYECFYVLNGGGWGCIYSHQPLPSRCLFLPNVDGPRPWSGRSAPAHQWLKSQWSVVMTISMAIVHLMCRHMLDKAVTDCLAMHPGRSTRTLKMHFTEPVTFGFFWFFNDRTVRA